MLDGRLAPHAMVPVLFHFTYIAAALGTLDVVQYMIQEPQRDVECRIKLLY